MYLDEVFGRSAETLSGKACLPGAAVMARFNVVPGRGFASVRRRPECGGTTMDVGKGFLALAARNGRLPITRFGNKSETPSRSRRSGRDLEGAKRVSAS